MYIFVIYRQAVFGQAFPLLSVRVCRSCQSIANRNLVFFWGEHIGELGFPLDTFETDVDREDPRENRNEKWQKTSPLDLSSFYILAMCEDEQSM